MQIPNLALAFAVRESEQVLLGSIVKKVQELENNWIKLKLRSKSGAMDLIITPQIFFFSSYSMQAKQSSSGFGAFLRKRLEGKKILGVQQHGFDRVVLFEFADFFLVLEFFAKGNIVLADKDMKILGVQHREQWKDRVLEKGAQYKFPSSKGKNPVELSLLEFEEILQKSDSEIIRELIKALNIAPVVAEEALLESGIEKSVPAKSLSKEQAKKLLEKIRGFYSISVSRLKPVVSEKDSEQIALPFEFKGIKSTQSFGSLNALFDEFFCKSFLGKAEKAVSIASGKKLAKLQRSLSIQLGAKARLEEKIGIEKKKGEAIFSHYAELQQAFEALKEAKGKNEKEVMYKMPVFVCSVDLKKRKLVVEFD